MVTSAQRARAAANRARALRFLHHKNSLRSINAIRYVQAKRRGVLARRRVSRAVMSRQLRHRELHGRFNPKIRAPNPYKARRSMFSSMLKPRPSWRHKSRY